MWILDAPNWLVTGSQILFVTTFFIQFLFVTLLFGRLAFYKSKANTSPFTPSVSIIVAARNEQENLSVLLPMLLKQSYPTFEIIIVNNHSQDESKQVVEKFQSSHTNLRLIELNDYSAQLHGKKYPLSVGIELAQYDHFLFTDADCRPASTDWLRLMASSFSDSHELVLGYGPLFKEKGFLNRCFRFDAAWIGMNYFSFALANIPYMGVGRNIAYSRKVFDSVNGFNAHSHISSGDDDLFVQDAANKTQAKIQIHPNSFCPSGAQKSLKDWLHQKARHYTTAGNYKVFKKALLGIYPMSLFLLHVSFVILSLLDENWIFSCPAMVLILLLKWWIQGKAMVKLDEKGLALFFPFWDLMYAISIPVVYVTQLRKPKNKW